MYGETVGLGSKRFGWLQTFLSCMSTFITDSRFPVSSVSFVLALLIKSSYRNRCLFDKGHLTSWLYFLGICFSTSDFSLRSKKGLRTLCNLCIKSLLYSAEPSTILVRGLENHSLKSLWDSKTWGIRKCIKDHNSIKLFCKGVPVSKSLPPTLGKLSSNCHLCDLKFFMCWASSKIKYCHCFRRKLEWSVVTNL